MALLIEDQPEESKQLRSLAHLTAKTMNYQLLVDSRALMTSNEQSPDPLNPTLTTHFLASHRLIHPLPLPQLRLRPELLLLIHQNLLSSIKRHLNASSENVPRRWLSSQLVSGPMDRSQPQLNTLFLTSKTRLLSIPVRNLLRLLLFLHRRRALQRISRFPHQSRFDLWSYSTT